MLIRAGMLTPKKVLGQHFMVDDKLLTKMVDYAELSKNDVVLEIGSGLGFLTALIAKRAKLVYAVELDHRMAEYLRAKFPESCEVKIIEGDFLELELNGFNKVVSNPPYAISTPMLLKLVEYSPELMVLTLQEEFSRKLYAKPGSLSYGRLSVLVELNFEFELLERIPRSAFYPKSRVRSVMIRLRRKPNALTGEKIRAVKAVVDRAFSFRNRLLRVFLKKAYPNLSINLDLNKLRVYQAPPHVFLKIAEAFLKEV